MEHGLRSRSEAELRLKALAGGLKPHSPTQRDCTPTPQRLCHPIDGASRPWRPSALIRFSCLVHLGAVAASVMKPRILPWAVAAVAVNHLLFGIGGLSPKASWLGPNLSRLPITAREEGVVAITLDDGPDPEVTPRVLDLLDRYRVTASFFCIGARAVRFPEIGQEIARRGHAMENHSYHHYRRFALLGPAAIRRELTETQAALNRLAGRRPCFFRAVAGLRNPFLEPALCRSGLRLVSWTRRGFDTLDRSPRRVAARLTRGLRAGDILVAHDGSSARTRAGVPVVLEALSRVLDSIAENGLRAARLDYVIRDE
jgi:peptidoglycan/xylan/chitin deacetylase (PgdA/CDA1 family)